MAPSAIQNITSGSECIASGAYDKLLIWLISKYGHYHSSKPCSWPNHSNVPTCIHAYTEMPMLL